jgi:H+/Cl- antiporter ClcA
VSSTRRPSPEPLEANDQVVAAVITGGWVIALIVLLAVRTDIPASDRWWIWTCVTGVVLGLFGLLYVPFLKRSRARAAQRRARSSG